VTGTAAIMVVDLRVVRGDALVRTAADDVSDVWFAIDCLVVAGSIALAIALGAATLRRRTA
jgi:hypothetical protein